MNEPIPSQIYVSAHGQRIVMPGNQPDWPQDGQLVDILNPYQRRLVIDGDLAPKPDAGEPIEEPSSTETNPHDAGEADADKPVTEGDAQ